MRFLLAASLALTAMSQATADSKPGDYLADGKFKERLEVRDVQGGFAGFTGRFWVVEPDGSWSSGMAFNEKLKVESSGKLSKEQMSQLADALAKYDLASLKSTGKAGANPHVVKVQWGKVKAELTMKTTAPLPKADPGSLEGRYSGTVDAVRMVAGKDAKE